MKEPEKNVTNNIVSFGAVNIRTRYFSFNLFLQRKKRIIREIDDTYFTAITYRIYDMAYTRRMYLIYYLLLTKRLLPLMQECYFRIGFGFIFFYFHRAFPSFSILSIFILVFLLCFFSLLSTNIS